MSPQPRYRIYTSLRSYYGALRSPAGAEGTEATRRLEHELERITTAGFARCASQARVAIYLAIRALIKPGQSVVLSPYTIHDVVNMVICAGGVPRFADIRRETCNLDPVSVRSLIDGSTGAVMTTHLHGYASDIRAIEEICREAGVPLVEDCAQAFGARVDGRFAGTFGAAGIFSFGMYKNVNSFYGGAIIGRDEALAAAVDNLLHGVAAQERSVFLKKTMSALTTDIATWPPLFNALTFRIFRYGYLHDIEALNKRVRIEDDPRMKQSLPDTYLRRIRPEQAALVLEQLTATAEFQGEQMRAFDAHSRVRIRFAKMYHEGLSDLAELICPPLLEDGSHIYTYFPIQYRERHRLIRHMMERGSDVAAQHLRNCADLECFHPYRRQCENAARTAEEIILLPTYPRYSDADVMRNISSIRSFFGKS